MKCTATNRQGKPCRINASPGANVCWRHGANAPQVKANAAIRVELSRWGMDGNTDLADPGETLLRLLTQSKIRAELYSAEVSKMVDEHGMQEALTGDVQVIDPQSGTLTKINEYVRAMAQLELQERDRCAKFAKLALDAGIAERQVRIAERQGALIEQVLMTAFERMDLSADQRQLAPAAIREALQLVA